MKRTNISNNKILLSLSSINNLLISADGRFSVVVNLSTKTKPNKKPKRQQEIVRAKLQETLRSHELTMTPSNKIVKLDGRIGEGGGQLLRVAVALAAVTGTPIRIDNVRGNREGKRGGGKVQSSILCSWHLTFIRPKSSACSLYQMSS